MPEANARQVGGTHYRSAFQHWDLCHELDLGYFEGQISKYGTRARAKNGAQDIEKALHFTHKLLELHVRSGRQPTHKFITEGRLAEYVEANRLNDDERVVLSTVLRWQGRRDLLYVVDRLEAMLAALRAPEPTSAYTNQDGSAS